MIAEKAATSGRKQSGKVRVIRLGEFSPVVLLFTEGQFFENCRSSQNFWTAFIPR
jgi:hypothetical protein